MDATERYYTREAERAALRLVGKHREQERQQRRAEEARQRAEDEQYAIKAEQSEAVGGRPRERGTRGRRGMR